MSKGGKRARTTARQKQREVAKLADKLDKLVAESPGGSPARAIAVTSASVIDVKARAFRCGRCEGELEWKAEHAEFAGAIQLRNVDMVCKRCFAPRKIWFSLGAPTAN